MSYTSEMLIINFFILLGLQEGDGSLPQVNGVLMGLDHVDVALKKLLHGVNGVLRRKLKICGLPEEQFCEQAFVRYTKQDLLYFHGVSVTRLSMAFCGTTRWEYRPRRNYARSNFSEPNGKRGEQNDGESEGDKRDDDE
ncbi:hypothetical protein C5167_006377 [Papaver somniferum]|uniref:Uncharacterized protein n=1 Tax=Papaver somniferum TaxID=3469 RepID=A0A4Y7JD53_PAPSO|nr:hypothetical protein C5167_006377 [Papaver somniferum]